MTRVKDKVCHMYARAYIYNPNINIHDGVVMRARMTQIQENIREAELSGWRSLTMMAMQMMNDQ